MEGESVKVDQYMSERNDQIKRKEERLRSVLFPVESYVLEVERILVWERPLYSAILLVSVNLFFWLATTWRVLSLIGFTGFILVVAEGIVHYIWSRRHDNETEEPVTGWCKAAKVFHWTEIHPQLLGVPDLCRIFAEKWQQIQDKIEEAMTVRQNQRAKHQRTYAHSFFVTSVFILSSLAILGIYIPGIYISYFTVMGVLVYPGLCYHNIINKFNVILSPLMQWTETKLHIKRQRSKRSEALAGGDTSVRASTLVDDDESDDEELKDFIPNISLPSVTPDKISGGGGNTEEGRGEERGFTPVMNISPCRRRRQIHDDDFVDDDDDDRSRDYSDDDILSDDLPHFARGLGSQMPSIYDTLDNSPAFTPRTNEMPSYDHLDNSSDTGTGEISFVPSHFRDSSDEEGLDDLEPLEQGLSFENVANDDEDARNVVDVLSDMVSQGKSSLVSAVTHNAPGVASTLAATASRISDVASAVRGAAASVIGGAETGGESAGHAEGGTDSNRQTEGGTDSDRQAEGGTDTNRRQAEVCTDTSRLTGGEIERGEEGGSDVIDKDFVILDKEEIEAASKE